MQLSIKSVKSSNSHKRVENKSLIGRIAYYIQRDWLLYLLVMPAMIYFVIFKYMPMYGITIAFKDFNMFQGIMASPWIGFKHFVEVFSDAAFWNAVKNTLVLNLLSLVISTPATILLALMLNEIMNAKFKKLSQSILYLPHFVSWVVVAGLIQTLFSVQGGSVNNIITKLGGQPIPFMIDNGWWIFTYILANLWKGIGWGTIIYLAALAGVDESLYEAAYIDGATKLKRIWYITIPAIKSTIVIMLILDISKMLAIGLDAPLLLQNGKVIEVAEVISTYVYKMGLERVQYSFATAVGLFQSIINITLLLLANFITKMLGEEGIL